MISAGILTERINILRPAAGTDAIGQPTGTPELVAAVWASIKHPSGLAAIKAGADVSIVKASIRIRYRTGLDAGMWVEHGAARYDIKAVLPNRAEGYVDLVCEVAQ